MKNKFFTYAVISLIGVSVIGIGAVSARGFGMMNFGWGPMMGEKSLSVDEIASNTQAMFQKEAEILGLSVDDVKNAWAQGKSLKDLMKEKNISQDTVNQKIKDMQLQQYKDQLQNLVSKGVITQAQADQRLQVVQNNAQNLKKGMMKFHGGWMF